jgi:CheY-like chemotaxis protein
MMHFFRKRKLSELKQNMTRDELVRRSRILVIDDERPAIIDDLKSARFSVDHVPDVSSQNLELVDHPLYDLILLDFGQVGKTFGDDQGLSLLRHIKRVNPAIVVLTYTSKALETRHADFYRLADGTLAKDAGIQESLEKIEDALRKAHSLDNVWSGLLSLCAVEHGSKKDVELQDLYIRGLASPRQLEKLKKSATDLVSEGGKTVALTLVAKLVELGVQSYFG